jgi:DNA-binding response OmpR family regulator
VTPSEFRLLALLALEPERAFSRREIVEHLWRSSHVGDRRTCDVHVKNLRRKIERDPARPERLVTVRGVGYMLRAA